MVRTLPHFHLRDLGRKKPFATKGGGGGRSPSDVPNRAAHAQVLLAAIDRLPDIKTERLPGVPMICASLYRPFITQNLLRYLAGKILLLNTTNFRGDYLTTTRWLRHSSNLLRLS